MSTWTTPLSGTAASRSSPRSSPSCARRWLRHFLDAGLRRGHGERGASAGMVIARPTRMAGPIRVAIADDHAPFRQGLRSLLELRAEIAVVAETERADGGHPMLRDTPCDILLLDLQMDRNSLPDIGALAAQTKVIVVTASEQAADALAAIRAGASGVVFKRFAIETLVDAIRAVAEGDMWLAPTLRTAGAPGPEPLTPREHEIVRHVALGLRNAEVASRLAISEDTVKTHLNNVFQKLGLRDRVQLTLYALRRGLIGMHERP
ncbi:MAG: response regulator transcription factor [Deltaproteobacteria bacterium]|nr:MAG: response regulator transcription factor [Deltaproteobacteria bacterium]